MLFQTPTFIVFFTVVAAAFYLAGLRRGRWVLLVASYVFYATWNAAYVGMLLGITALDFGIALALDRPQTRNRRALLTAGVAANLSLLAFLKYTNFGLATWWALTGGRGAAPVLHLLVPLGISFHTFQSISYLVDVYRGRMRAVRSPLDYALYLAFFPQLVSGPIVRAELWFAERTAWRRPDAPMVWVAVRTLVVGLIKKTVVADQFATVANAYFAAPSAHPGTAAAWSGAVAFALQIYFDFSGYTDIVIGLAALLGFRFPQNFRRPYLARNLGEFWHRWHITLSTWLRDYLYIPLGGSRGSRLFTMRNLMLTMVLGGLWHGANWTFVAWGAYHGALLCLERIPFVARLRDGTTLAARIPNVALTVVLVVIGWVFFRAQTFADAGTTLRAMFVPSAGPAMLVGWQVAVAACFFTAELAREAGLRAPRVPLIAQTAALAGLLLALELLSYQGDSTPFIYFQF